ncbi:MAG: nitroreductase family protein [Clostridia bacterium]|nr:nitroreductase family protein [Clostridia bacterium]
MINSNYYDMIFKRKSYHKFPEEIGKISKEELKEIEDFFAGIEPLYPDIKVEMRIVPEKKVIGGRGAEYCLLLYSEKKDNYLQNIGYIGEQLDLFLVSKNIGTLWFGIGRPDKQNYHGLSYAIMIEIAKVSEDTFRKDMFKSKRKELAEIWHGEELPFSNIIRFAPSACNSQPWIIENNGNTIDIYRYKAPGKRGIMPILMVRYFNQIDMGILLCFFDICLAKEGLTYNRKLYTDNKDEEKILFATYTKA